MFFIMGISDGRTDFEFSQMMVCQGCGRYGRYMVYMTYTVLSLFFIPCFKWNKKYYVQTSCCGQTYSLDPEVGKLIAKGEQIEIQPEDLTVIGGRNGSRGRTKICMNCAYKTDEDFEYCPKCGTKF